MSLPAGFNPNSMSFGNITRTTPVIEIPRNTSTYSSYGSWGNSYRGSLWSRFNNGVASIGNWFAEKSESVLGWISLITMAIIVITCIVKVISTWVDEGFWMALLMAIGVCIGGVIAWYIAFIAILIGVNIVMYGFRFLFWNGWTLLISLVAAGSIYCYNAYGNSNLTSSPVETEVVTPATQTYRCTAWELNIRSMPNKTSSVLGKIKKGDTVEVYETVNGFAKIRYNGQDGYASLKYLTTNQ